MSCKTYLTWIVIAPAYLLLAALLFLSESCTISKKKSLREGEGIVVTVSSEEVEKANDGKLVHVSGMAGSSETLVDSRFETVSAANSLKLERRVEMYQWEERESKRYSSDSNTTRVRYSYSYHKKWSRSVIDSSGFKRSGHINPRKMPVKGEETYAANPKLGAFRVTRSLVDKMKTQMIVPKDTVGLEGARIKGKRIYYRPNSSQVDDLGGPEIGDVRISFHAQVPHEATIIARQSGDTLKTYKTSNGGSIEMVSSGHVEPGVMFSSERLVETLKVWLVRFACGFFFFLIFIMKSLSFSSSLRGIPAAILFSLLLTLGIISTIIAFTWMFYRPITSLLLLLCGLIFLFLFWFLNKKPRPLPSSEKNSPLVPPLISAASEKPAPPVIPVESTEPPPVDRSDGRA